MAGSQTRVCGQEASSFKLSSTRCGPTATRHCSVTVCVLIAMVGCMCVLPGSAHDAHRGHDEMHSEHLQKTAEGAAGIPFHRCIHDEVKMADVPVVQVTYPVDPAEALIRERTTATLRPPRDALWATVDGRGVASEDRQQAAPSGGGDVIGRGDTAHHNTEINMQGFRRADIALATSSFNNMRVSFYFNVDGNGQCTTVGETVTTYRGTTTACKETDILTEAKRSYVIDTLMTQAATFLSNALNVVRVSGNLTVPGARCGASPGVAIPTNHKTVGVSDTDFILYVSANPQATESSTVAFAATCFRDQNGRPLVGHINFIPSALGNAVTLRTSSTDLDIRTAIHEASHALGFSSPFFSSFGWVNESGYRFTTGGTTSEYRDALGKTVTLIQTPRVVAAAKAYFGCSTMTGVEIEDQGGAGTQGSHWEKRILYEEFIAGVLSSARTYISTFTLAYFEDTGFFTANYEYAEDANMRWGKGKGCPFLQEKCNSATNKASGEFCFDSNAATRYCTSDRTAGGKCDVTTYSSIASAFRYFEDPKLGAQVLVSDYCPAVIPFSDKICIEAKNSDIQDIYGNTYHSASRCFVSNLIQSDFDEGSQQDSRCFPYSCSIVTGQLLLNIRGQTARCPSDLSAGYADLSKVSGYKGVILCPAASELCSDFNAPTPAPTPAPPTPVPTPAPPGFTPAPAPVERTSKQWYNFNMPATCAGRASCAANLSSLFPACRLLAKRLVDCYGTNCDGDIMSWLSDKGLTSKCQDTSTAATLCQDSFVGADALCRLATGSAASTTVLVAMLALLVGLLATVV